MASGQNHLSGQEILGQIDQQIKKEFDANRRVLSFEEYLNLLGDPQARQLRGSAKYIVDMMDHFGKEEIKNNHSGLPLQGSQSGMYRFNIFSQPPEQGDARKIVGQEVVQNQIYNSLKGFSRQRINNKMILLHGPNGSAKTSIIHSIMAGLEKYSLETEGAVYSINWVFPIDKYVKGNIGIQSYSPTREPVASYAKLPDEEVISRLPCEMKDHPLLIIPQDQRRNFLDKLLGPARTAELWESMPEHFTRGNPCQRCKQIFDALLLANNGDFRKVLMHVQVERFYYSRRYRKGLVTIEPQMHVDAQYHQLTYNKSIGNLPASLQGLNLFSLTGELIEGNRGIIEYSDLLKRPVDTFKYLLIACETSSVNVGSTIAYLDAVMLGSTNELQLDAFKEFPDFNSFKARIELIRVPYLLSVQQEEQIYKPELGQIAGEKHVSPHTSWALALWGVLTRLKKPNSINYPPSVSSVVSNLTPLEKARLYDSGEVPVAITPEEKKLLRSSLRKLTEEYTNIPYYEGRMGASARELRTVLIGAAQNPEFKCLSPLSVLREMEEFVKRVTEYEFLKQDVKDGYHDSTEFINVVRNEYLNRVDREVRDSMGLYESAQWEDFLRKYIQHISMVLKKEKIKNSITGKSEDPDMNLISEFEKIVEAPGDASHREAFRQNIISQVGAWSLDHPQAPVVYAKVFPDFWLKLEKHYYESQKSLLTKMHNAVLIYDTNASTRNANEEGSLLAKQTVDNMKSRLGYCDECAKEVITFLMRQRY